MTQQIALPLGLSAGPAEAGARVIRRALDQIGQAAGAAGTAVQGVARSLDGLGGTMRADRVVGELKRVEAGARGAGGAAKAAFEGVTGTDLGRRSRPTPRSCCATRPRCAMPCAEPAGRRARSGVVPAERSPAGSPTGRTLPAECDL